MSSAALDFARDGFLHVPAVFSPEELRELDRDFDRITDQLASSGERTDATWDGEATDRLRLPGSVIHHTHNVQQYSAAWLRALLHPGLLDVAAELLGEDIVLHHSKLFLKPPRTGSPFPMHQDWTYFPTQKDSMIAAIIHVSDATEEMGCLRVYPGSHELGRVPASSGRVPCPTLEDYPVEGAPLLEARAGDVVFFHYFTLHGSTPNRSEQPRKTVLAQLYRGDDVPERADHPDERLVLRGWNHHTTRSKAGGSKAM